MTTVPTTLVPPRRAWNHRATVIAVAIGLVALIIAATAYLVFDDRGGPDLATNEAPSVESIIRAREAETARWEGLAARDATLRGRRADAARLAGLAASEGAIVLTRGQQADAARLAGLAEYYERHGGAGSS